MPCTVLVAAKAKATAETPARAPLLAHSFDEENCFSYVVTPEFWWPWQAAPPIQLKDAPKEWGDLVG